MEGDGVTGFGIRGLKSAEVTDAVLNLFFEGDLVTCLDGELGSVCRERCGEALGTRGEVTDLVEPDLVLAQVDGKGLSMLTGLSDIEEAEGFLVVIDGDLTDACGARPGE